MSQPSASGPSWQQPAGNPQPAQYAAPAPLAQPARRASTTVVVLGAIGIVLLALVLLAVIGYLVMGLGVGAFATGAVLALLPLGAVLWGIRWIDRWEPEPRGALWFAFLWGAGLSVAIALVVGLIVEIAGYVAGFGTSEFTGAVVQAPIVEELGKGLGVLILFWALRGKHFDGPVDGIVYSSMVAVGFAFTENILYFGNEVVLSGGDPFAVGFIFFVRAVMSPFAHVMFTACIGLALGIAARRSGGFGGLGAFAIGVVPAMLLHALWNGASFVVGGGLLPFIGYYAVVQVPLFVGAIVLVAWLRRQEAALVRARLAEYARVGWFLPFEVEMLGTWAGRRQALAWARSRGRGDLMRRFQLDATRLAYARNRIVIGRHAAGAQRDEAALLDGLLRYRPALYA